MALADSHVPNSLAEYGFDCLTRAEFALQRLKAVSVRWTSRRQSWLWRARGTRRRCTARARKTALSNSSRGQPPRPITRRQIPLKNALLSSRCDAAFSIPFQSPARRGRLFHPFSVNDPGNKSSTLVIVFFLWEDVMPAPLSCQNDSFLRFVLGMATLPHCFVGNRRVTFGPPQAILLGT